MLHTIGKIPVSSQQIPRFTTLVNMQEQFFDAMAGNMAAIVQMGCELAVRHFAAKIVLSKGASNINTTGFAGNCHDFSKMPARQSRPAVNAKGVFHDQFENNQDCRCHDRCCIDKHPGADGNA